MEAKDWLQGEEYTWCLKLPRPRARPGVDLWTLTATLIQCNACVIRLPPVCDGDDPARRARARSKTFAATDDVSHA